MAWVLGWLGKMFHEANSFSPLYFRKTKRSLDAMINVLKFKFEYILFNPLFLVFEYTCRRDFFSRADEPMNYAKLLS